MPGDADDCFDERVPVGARQRALCGKDGDGAVLLTASRLIPRESCILHLAFGGDGADRFKQFSLITFDLCDEMIARRQRRREGFFGHAWHRP